MEFVSLFDVLINLIPIYRPWIIFGLVALRRKAEAHGLTIKSHFQVRLSQN